MSDDIRDEPGRGMKIAEENGCETWLDLQTGEIVEGLPVRVKRGAPPTESTEEECADMTEPLFADAAMPDFSSGALMAVVRTMLDGHHYKYLELDANQLVVTIRNDHGAYSVLFTTNDKTDLVRSLCCYGSYVPEGRRVAVAEAASRINMGLLFGSFELDFSDGELRFRISIDVEDGLLSEKMVDNMLGFTLSTMDRFNQALMQVAFGEVEPEIAVRGVP